MNIQVTVKKKSGEMQQYSIIPRNPTQPTIRAILRKPRRLIEGKIDIRSGEDVLCFQ